MASNYFGANAEAASKMVSDSLKEIVSSWSPGLYRWVSDNTIPLDLCSSKFDGGNATLISKTSLWAISNWVSFMN